MPAGPAIFIAGFFCLVDHCDAFAGKPAPTGERPHGQTLFCTAMIDAARAYPYSLSTDKE